MSSRELALEVEAMAQHGFSGISRKQPQSHEFLLEDVNKYKK